MCGICGQINSDIHAPIDRHVIESMNAAIRHRGPDSDGFFVDGRVALAMRRLSIIDLAGGDQPIGNEDGSVQVVFNGEIYNFRELRRDLERSGHTFTTHTDTETLVHLYEAHGDACVKHLRGMFAFAIWDKRNQRLLLARDRLGQKPLYYSDTGDCLLFGSEIKCLLQHPRASRDIDIEAIHHYLTLQYVPDPLTAFRAIRQLPPAHVLTWQNGKTDIRKYWDLSYEPKQKGDKRELQDELRRLTNEAVRIRMVSDVPLGAHLSGGIDSSVVVALMAGLQPEPIRTFSIGFEEDAFNETGFARQIAERYGTEHHEFTMRPDAADVLSKMVRHFDQPFADAAAIPNWYLAQMTREHVTVALNGDGGDEAFAGYQRYFADSYADAYRLIPEWTRRHLLNPVLTCLPVDTAQPIETNHRMALRRMAQAAELPRSASVVRWGSYFDEAAKHTLYTPHMRGLTNTLSPSWELLDATYRAAIANKPLDRTLYTDVHHYLPGALLPKVDRMTMAHSLEARSPFLDHKLMGFAAQLPCRLKVSGMRTKAILRDTFADLLPHPLVERRKMGFGVPLTRWFRSDLYDMAANLLLEPGARLRPYIQQQPVETLLHANRDGREDHGKRLWALLFLEAWLREYDQPAQC